MNYELLANESIDTMLKGLDARYQARQYRTDKARVDTVTRDQYGRSVSAVLTIDGVSGNTIKAYGSDIGEGEAVEVVNVGTNVAPDYRIAAILPGVATEQPQAIISNYGGIDLLNLAALRVRSTGFILLGGDITETSDGDLVYSGSRIEERNYGIEGFTNLGLLTFGLYALPRLYTGEGQAIQFNPGDLFAGLLAGPFLRVDTEEERLSWNIGDLIVLESYMENDNPFTRVSGLFRAAEHSVGEGIELGKQPDGPYVLQLLNKFGVPLILFRAGLSTDPNGAYARIGPPSPHPNLTVTDVNGLPVVDMHGGCLRVGTVIADMLNVKGVHAGRAEFLKTGTVFNSFSDLGTATGVVIGFDEEEQVGKFLSLFEGQVQWYIGSDGKLYSGDGQIHLERTKLRMPSAQGLFEFYDSQDADKSPVLDIGVIMASAAYGVIQATGGPSRNNYDRATLILRAQAYNNSSANIYVEAADELETVRQIRFDADKMYFFGIDDGATRPTVTGSRGGNAALASLITGLASLGLVADSSSA